MAYDYDANPITIDDVPANKLLEEFDKSSIHEQISEIVKIVEKIMASLKSLTISGLSSQNEKNVMENQLSYAVKCLNIIGNDVKFLNSSPEMYKLNKVIKILKDCSETIKNNAIAIINTGDLFSDQKNQEILRTLNDMSKIVTQLKEHESIIRLGEKGLITMLNGYKATCSDKLTETTYEVDNFVKDMTSGIQTAKERLNNEFASTANIIRARSIKFTALVSSGLLILGICLGVSIILGMQINNLIEQEMKLSKTLQDKENYANMLSGVEFYKKGDMFYISFDKNIKIQQFKTENGEQAVGYKK